MNYEDKQKLPPTERAIITIAEKVGYLEKEMNRIRDRDENWGQDFEEEIAEIILKEK